MVVPRYYHGTSMATEVKSDYFRRCGSAAAVSRKIGHFRRRGSTMAVKNFYNRLMIRAFAGKKISKKNLLPRHFRGDGNEQNNRFTAIAAVVPRPRKQCNFTSVATEMTW